MVKFLKLQYKMGRIDKEYLDKLIELGRITETDKEYIIGE